MYKSRPAYRRKTMSTGGFYSFERGAIGLKLRFKWVGAPKLSRGGGIGWGGYFARKIQTNPKTMFWGGVCGAGEDPLIYTYPIGGWGWGPPQVIC